MKKEINAYFFFLKQGKQLSVCELFLIIMKSTIHARRYNVTRIGILGMLSSALSSLVVTDIPTPTIFAMPISQPRSEVFEIGKKPKTHPHDVWE